MYKTKSTAHTFPFPSSTSSSLVSMGMVMMEEQEEDFGDPPVGYRFVPTDQELVNHYLMKKIFCNTFQYSVFLETNASDFFSKPPKTSVPFFNGEREWFFFIHNIENFNHETIRTVADGLGFWQSNGEKPVLDAEGKVIAFKIHLVYYSGRFSSKARKTHWKMDEYRMPIQFYIDNDIKEEWALGRLTRGRDDYNL